MGLRGGVQISRTLRLVMSCQVPHHLIIRIMIQICIHSLTQSLSAPK